MKSRLAVIAVTVCAIAFIATLSLGLFPTRAPRAEAAGIPVFDAAVFTAIEFMYAQDTVHTGTDVVTTGGTLENLGQDILEYVERFVRSELRRKLLAMVQQQIISYIQGGGSPQFVTNWDDHIMNAVLYTSSQCMLAASTIDFCNLTGAVGVAAGAVGSLASLAFEGSAQSLENLATCTLNKVVPGGDPRVFLNDFSQGGWNAYLTSLMPNNIPASANALIQTKCQELGSRAGTAAALEALAGNGFLSPKQCNGDGACTIQTPGSVVGGLVGKAVGSDIDFIIQAEEIEDLIGAITNAAFMRITTEGLGLLYDTKSSAGPGGCSKLTSPALEACEKKLSTNKAGFQKAKNQLNVAITQALKSTDASVKQAQTLIAKAITNLTEYKFLLSTLLQSVDPAKPLCPKSEITALVTPSADPPSIDAKIAELQSNPPDGAPIKAALTQAKLDIQDIPSGNMSKLLEIEASVEAYLNSNNSPLVEKAQQEVDNSEYLLTTQYNAYVAQCSDTTSFSFMLTQLVADIDTALAVYQEADAIFSDTLVQVQKYNTDLIALKLNLQGATCPFNKQLVINQIDAELKTNGYVNKTITASNLDINNNLSFINQLTTAKTNAQALPLGDLKSLDAIKNSLTTIINPSTADGVKVQAETKNATVASYITKKINGSPSGFQTKLDQCN